MSEPQTTPHEESCICTGCEDRRVVQTTEIRFLRWVVNMTTGWRINGFNNQEEALREIERVCRERINYVSS